MRKIISKICGITLSVIIVLGQAELCFAQNNDSIKMIKVDDEYDIYKLRQTKMRQASLNADGLIEYNNTYYIHLQNDLYAKAEMNTYNEDDNLEMLRTETKEIVENIFENSRKEGWELLNDVVEVYVPINEDLLSRSSTLAANYPVTNEQVRYVAVSNEKVIASGSNAFQDYANRTLSNAASAVLQGAISSLNPYAGAIATVAALFPSKYNEIRSYTGWTFGVKLQEEKVVQLSWVYINNSPYLGAQTQFTTVRYTSILTKGLQTSVVDTSNYLYYRTPNYNKPETIARQYYNDTWIERITSYNIAGVKIGTLSQ